MFQSRGSILLVCCCFGLKDPLQGAEVKRQVRETLSAIPSTNMRSRDSLALGDWA